MGDGECVNDRRDGRWSFRCPDGSRVLDAYREGRPDGISTINDANGATAEREFWKNGRWMGEPGLCTE